MSATEIYSPGLEGVIAGETAISTVEGGLRYRGYPVTELADRCTFDEVAYLLLYEELPSQKQLREFQLRFAARTIVSTEADLHAGVVGAIGALKGRLHGGANEKVMDLLHAAGGPDSAEAWIRDMIARKEKIMGFGHRVYKTGDLRAKILREY